MANKLNLNAQNIVKMLAQKNPEDFAYWLDVILDDLASTIDNRAVCEFHIVETGTKKDLASTCYVTPPAKGEFIKIKNLLYEVVLVVHTFDRSHEAGKILVRPADMNLIM
jgi:hypothetical protein